MNASAIDYTARIPTETLHEIIERVEDRKDRYAVIHVCTRWRQIAFAHQRRYCWFNCGHQNVWQLLGKAHNELCYAQLRCRADHKKHVDISLQNMSAGAIEITLRLLDQNMARLQTLSVGWSRTSLGPRIFDILSRQPAPALESLSLHDYSQVRGEPDTRIPSHLFAGDTPPLSALWITSVALPEEPLKQFASLRTLGISGIVYGPAPLALDDIVRHFPAITSATFGTQTDILVDLTTMPRCAGWLAQLTQLTARETVINALLDARPELNTLSHIAVSHELLGGSGVQMERTPSHLLTGLKSSKDVRLQVQDHFTSRQCDLHFTANLPGTSYAAQRTVAFSILPGLLTRADPLKPLRITRLEIDHRAFAVVWPLLAPGALQGLRLIIGTTLSDSDWPAAPRVMPAMRQLVLAHAQSGVDTAGTRVCISARSLVSFVRATFALGPQSPRFRLRLENVDVEGSMRSVEGMFEERVDGRCSAWCWLNS